MDKAFIDMPEGSYSFALNTVTESENSDHGFVSNEQSNSLLQSLGANFRIIGSRYMTDRTVLFVTDNNTSIIATLDQSDNYEVVVDDTLSEYKLNFHMSNPVFATYRLRKGCEDTIYFVDGKRNRPRYFNFASPEDFQTSSLWDARKFTLQKTTSIFPTLENFSVEENGKLAPGSYSFAIELLDGDLNPTEYISSSDSIIIYSDSYTSNFKDIHGSLSSAEENALFTNTNKSISFSIDNLDPLFDFYRIAIIEATSGLGIVTRVVTTDPIPTSQTTFTYTGSEAANISTLEEVQALSNVVHHAEHVEQLENRLILGATSGKQYNPCNLQKYASRIVSNFTTREVILNNHLINSNGKRATKHVESMGYMPGEIYSFGIIYVFEDGTRSPVYHIPGKAAGDTSTNMSDNNVLESTFYTSTCSDYWGTDSQGNTLLNTNVRHHRFPTRCEATKPLLFQDDTVNAVDQNFIEVTVSGASAATELINVRVSYTNPDTTNAETYVYTFSPVGAITPFTFQFGGFLNNVNIPGITFTEIDSQGNDLGLISGFTYGAAEITEEVVLTDNSVYKSEIFGICFSEVELPSLNDVGGDCPVVGYEIVRNERTDEEKTIVDSGILLPVTESKENRKLLSHAQLAPDFGLTFPFGECAEHKADTFALINPEYKFRNKEWTNITYIQEGLFREDRTAQNAKIFQDISPGSSYDPEVHRKSEEDGDGFDFRNTTKETRLKYEYNCDITLPEAETNYLESLEGLEFDDSTGDAKEIFNLSSDNKIAIVRFSANIPATERYTATETVDNQVYPYVKMVRPLANPYSNYRNLPYYKEHEGVIYFDNTGTSTACMYNGDIYTSPMRYTSSFFYDVKIAGRDPKRSFWNIVVGALLVAAAVVLTPLSGGASLVTLPALLVGATATIASTALYYGIQQIATGISRDRFRKVYEELYDNGLRSATCDAFTHAIYETPTTLGPLNGAGDSPDDDEIRWHMDILTNLWFESSVNINWRSSLGNITKGFLDAPGTFRDEDRQSILFDKLVNYDTDNTGPTYQGYSKAELYVDNPDYYVRNVGKLFFHLPLSYDCCSTCIEDFPQRVVYSNQSFQEELTDNYRTFLPNNYRDIEGETGPITNLVRYGDRLHIHTEEAFWVLPHNYQERSNTGLITFIGSGEFFITPPKKVVDDESGMSAGTSHKLGTVKTPHGYFFVADKESKVYKYNGRNLEPISEVGMSSYYKQHIKNGWKEEYHRITGEEYNFSRNPLGRFGHGFLMTYDSCFERILLTKRDFEVERLNAEDVFVTDGLTMSIFENYQDTIDDCIRDGFRFLGLQDNQLVFEKDEIINNQAERLMKRIDPLPISPLWRNCGWTTSFSIRNNSWTSFHSYIPEFYIHSPLNFYSVNWQDHGLYKHNVNYNYQTFYGNLYPHIVEYVSVSSPLQTRYWNHIDLITEARSYDTATDCEVDERYVTYNKAHLYNSRQSTGEMELIVTDEETGDFFENAAKDLPGFQTTVDRHERNWSLNDIRDYRTDYTQPIFTKNKTTLQSSYYIDKVINSAAVDSTKDYRQAELLRDKYLVIRLIFDKFDDKKLILNYSSEDENPSMR